MNKYDEKENILTYNCHNKFEINKCSTKSL